MSLLEVNHFFELGHLTKIYEKKAVKIMNIL